MTWEQFALTLQLVSHQACQEWEAQAALQSNKIAELLAAMYSTT
jgi:hypothetical protein